MRATKLGPPVNMRAILVCVLLYLPVWGAQQTAAQHADFYRQQTEQHARFYRQVTAEQHAYRQDASDRGVSRARRSASDDDIAVLLRAHNDARASATPTAANMKNMFWDERLAFKAQTYSARCRYAANPDRSVGGEGFATAGENLFASAGSTGLEAAVAAWQGEGAGYDFTTNTCAEGADCSRYTQLMWAASYKVGCGWTVCPRLDNFDGTDVFFLVCNYGPEGNTGGDRPYRSGAECSRCAFGNVCTEDGLCIMDCPLTCGTVAVMDCPLTCGTVAVMDCPLTCGTVAVMDCPLTCGTVAVMDCPLTCGTVAVMDCPLTCGTVAVMDCPLTCGTVAVMDCPLTCGTVTVMDCPLTCGTVAVMDCPLTCGTVAVMDCPLTCGTVAVMDAPDNLAVTDVTFSSLSVSWAGSTSMVSNYVLTYGRQGGRNREVSPAPGPRATSATIVDLFPGTDYVISLKAAGTLMESLPVTVTSSTESVIVNVDCDATSMGVQIPLAGLPGINSSRVRLMDPQCRGTLDSDNLIVRTDLTDCGTTSQTTNGSDVIAFTNELIIDASEGQEVMSWPISCNFLVADWVGFEGEGLLFEIPKPRWVRGHGSWVVMSNPGGSWVGHGKHSIQVEDGEHKFNFNMHVFKSEAFDSPFRTSDYPISVFPSEPLYFGLFVDTSLPGYVMFAETCFATPSPDPQATPRYSIIENGCNVDETLTVYDTSPLEFQFSIASTQFQAEAMVYVHCRMIVCMEDDSQSRCAQGCVIQNSPIRNRRRRSRDDKRQALMKQGPILIEKGPVLDSLPYPSTQICPRNGSGYVWDYPEICLTLVLD
ncbi:hypothetical protein Bbelb_327860 [Branchiostoma belcheri]|nr:hypothetical protein Bbelb_327860 [Branchiostoma belcheri]